MGDGEGSISLLTFEPVAAAGWQPADPRGWRGPATERGSWRLGGKTGGEEVWCVGKLTSAGAQLTGQSA